MNGSSLRRGSFETVQPSRHRSPMKRFACSLIALVGLGLSSALFAANLEEGQITGTVVDAEAITIDTAKGERWYFNRDPALSVKLKVGERVTVHYYITGRGKVYAKKIEKARRDR